MSTVSWAIICAMQTVEHLPDPSEWVENYGDALYSYALSRLRDRSAAEDAVQDTFLAALQARDKFSGKSPAQTWLIGILKHKIIDLIRKQSRESPMEELPEEDPVLHLLFDPKGHWRSGLREWQVNPEKALDRKEFMETLAGCLKNLPQKLANVFTLRELEGLDSDEVCKVLGVSSTNLWVMLHRARLRLQACIEEKGFERPQGGRKS
jgi:RNA polymerase sigma-70 factor (ECF subfamily)